MMLGNKLNQFATFLCNPDNKSKQLFITSAAGWALASLAQTTGLIANKKLDKEEKKFLIPQEICDGIFNIGAYAAVTLGLINCAEKLFSAADKKGVLKTPTVLVKKIENQFRDAAGKIMNPTGYIEAYKKMGKNASVAATLAGTVLCACIITPIARNFVGGQIQKYSNKNKISDVPVKEFQPNSTPMYRKTTENYKPISINSFMKSEKIHNNNVPYSSLHQFGIRHSSGLKI